MKREIDARRRVRISVRAGEGTLKGTYLFDAKGALLATEEGEAPGRGLSAFLSSQIREMPRERRCGRGREYPSPSCVIYT